MSLDAEILGLPVAVVVAVVAGCAVSGVLFPRFRGWLSAVLAWPSAKARWFIAGFVLGIVAASWVSLSAPFDASASGFVGGGAR